MVRSACSLRTLSLGNLIITDDQFIACLRAVPSLHKLYVSNVTISNEVFRMLYASDSPDANKPLPNLKVFKYSGEIDLNFSMLVCLLRSWRNVHENALSDNVSICTIQVKSVTFQSRRNGVPDGHSLGQLRQLISEGMQIKLSTGKGPWL